MNNIIISRLDIPARQIKALYKNLPHIIYQKLESENSAAVISAYAQLVVLLYYANILRCSPGDISIAKTSRGKPYLADFPHFHFNISHTGNTVAAAFFDVSVGIDIEEKDRHISMPVAKKFFDITENEYIFSDELAQDCRFMEVWTKKEALVKRDGTGITKSALKTNVLGNSDIQTFYLEEFIISVCASSNIPYPQIISCSNLLTHQYLP